MNRSRSPANEKSRSIQTITPLGAVSSTGPVDCLNASRKRHLVWSNARIQLWKYTAQPFRLRDTLDAFNERSGSHVDAVSLTA